MTPATLIEHLKTLPQDKSILCQVVGQKSGAWSMPYTFVDIPDSSFIQLRVEHQQLVHLPMNTGDDNKVLFEE